MKPLSILSIMVFAAGIAHADKKDEGRFAPGPASSYPSKQTNDGVTVAAVAYDTEDLAHTAFGKLNPNQYGVLPVLVIIQNDTDQALSLNQIQEEYETATDRRLEATAAPDVKYLYGGPREPSTTGPTNPLPKLIKHKNPLDVWEIEGRGFLQKMLPAHESANGFFYFQAKHQPGARFYLTGMRVASTGKEILYFEIPVPTH
jgi:hypothetical protein